MKLIYHTCIVVRGADAVSDAELDEFGRSERFKALLAAVEDAVAIFNKGSGVFVAEATK